jgi:glyoxylase-like metal-dependent hydrolase (beta-lactamase superfamily II)
LLLPRAYLLIDTSWPANDGRDADRIVAAAKQAGISKIDHVLITHFHNDHEGGAPQLRRRMATLRSSTLEPRKAKNTLRTEVLVTLGEKVPTQLLNGDRAVMRLEN